MYTDAKHQFAVEHGSDAGHAGLVSSGRAACIASPQGADDPRRGGARGAQLLREQLPRARRPPGAASRPRSEALDARGYGLAIVRFICGTQDDPQGARGGESRAFLGTDDTILYGSCFDANGGLFETLLGEEDAIISDALNHASIIDGIRLCKAQRYRYEHGDMADLEAHAEGRGAARACG